ncbi:STAS domain-containing protein [Fictibacillus iocasae]|uniref:STAS domain-containing protein n=1 Tax=Fictibacillus iocasae TaxID=2715437 RepID=A0ABW2NNJ7_9BACL
MLQDLSVPILKIWKDTIALPLIGSFDDERAERMITSVLNECTSSRIRYVLISLVGLHSFDDGIKRTIQNLSDCLHLLGAQCIIIGISTELAITIQSLDSSIPTFATAHAGLEHILELQKYAI